MERNTALVITSREVVAKQVALALWMLIPLLLLVAIDINLRDNNNSSINN